MSEVGSLIYSRRKELGLPLKKSETQSESVRVR